MASEFPNEPNRVPPPSPTAPAPAGGGMIGRIQRLLLRPKEEWARIDPEPTTAMQVFMSWAVPLAAIGPICGFVGQQLFGIRVLFATFRPPLVTSGLRIGTPALASRGFGDTEFAEVADIIALALQPGADVPALRARVAALADAFPLYPGLEQ